jgi:nickel-dependent lactate racemase
MRIEFAYGDTHAAFIVPAGVGVDFVTPRELSSYDDVAGAVARAFSQPVDAPPLVDLVAGVGDADVLLVVSDLTRGGGTKVILPRAVEYLESIGVARAQIRILVARGAHRKLTKEEKQYFKSDELRRLKVDEHDCDDGSQMSALLLTKRGTPVRVNRLLKEVGLVILISPVSFHYFAGFGGGRKLVLPGSVDRQAILANHRLSLQHTRPVELHPQCRPGNTEDNPVSDDMDEALAALKNVYALNFFCDTNGSAVYINAGDPVQSHAEACEVYRGVHRVPVEASYDIAIVGCGGHPYDINLLQAHKSLKHATSGAVKRGGTILFYARCPEGVGSESLARAIAMPRKEFFDTAWREYDLNNQAGISLLTITDQHRVLMVTELEDATLEQAAIKRCSNAEACLAEALEAHGADRIAVIPYGSQTLPFVQRSDTS